MVTLWLHDIVGGVVAHTPLLNMSLLTSTIHLDVPLRGTKNTKPNSLLIPILHLLLIPFKFYTMSVQFLLCTQKRSFELVNLHEFHSAHASFSETTFLV